MTIPMAKPEITSLKNIRIKKINEFLKKEFDPQKAKFLIQNGEWLHKGNNNRFVLILENEIIGYCGIIPTQIYNEGIRVRAFWWIDLIISRKFRQSGYQTIFDEFITNRPETKLGFPNKFAVKIHDKHGWEIYENIKVLKFPLNAILIPGLKKYGYILCKLINLIISIKIKSIRSFKSKRIQKDANPDFKELIDLHHKTKKKYFTTFKDEEFFDWRYCNSPFKKDYIFYILRKTDKIHLTLIIRKIKIENGFLVRVVDLFGYLDDYAALVELFNQLISDSVKMGAIQITIFENNPKIKRLLFRNGFIFFKKVRFCYNGVSPTFNENSCMRWSISDSDNDFLD